MKATRKTRWEVKKAKDIPIKGQASMRRVCVTGVCALVTLLCGCTRTRFDCVLHLLLRSHGVQWNEEGEKITQGRETEQRTRGWGRRGSMVNENINHVNETYESVSRIALNLTISNSARSLVVEALLFLSGGVYHQSLDFLL